MRPHFSTPGGLTVGEVNRDTTADNDNQQISSEKAY